MGNQVRVFPKCGAWGVARYLRCCGDLRKDGLETQKCHWCFFPSKDFKEKTVTQSVWPWAVLKERERQMGWVDYAIGQWCQWCPKQQMDSPDPSCGAQLGGHKSYFKDLKMMVSYFSLCAMINWPWLFSVYRGLNYGQQPGTQLCRDCDKPFLSTNQPTYWQVGVHDVSDSPSWSRGLANATTEWLSGWLWFDMSTLPMPRKF